MCEVTSSDARSVSLKYPWNTELRNDEAKKKPESIHIETLKLIKGIWGAKEKPPGVMCAMPMHYLTWKLCLKGESCLQKLFGFCFFFNVVISCFFEPLSYFGAVCYLFYLKDSEASFPREYGLWGSER